MKEYIRYYYDIDTKEIKAIKKGLYLLKSDDNVLVFKKIYKTEEYVGMIDELCNNHNLKRNYIMRNKFGKLVSDYIGESFVLVKMMFLREELSYDLIIIRVAGSHNVTKIWENKILLIEKKLHEMQSFGSEIRGIILYYLGLAEIAVSLMRKYEYNKAELYLQNERIFHPNLALSYLDQSMFILDYKSRNAAEYIKSKVLVDGITEAEIERIIENNNYNEYELIYLFCRIMYPTYFFDVIEKEGDEDSMFEKIKIIYDRRHEVSRLYKLLIKNYMAKGINIGNLAKKRTE